MNGSQQKRLQNISKLVYQAVEQLRIKGGGVTFTKFVKKTIRYHIDDMSQHGKRFYNTTEYL